MERPVQTGQRNKLLELMSASDRTLLQPILVPVQLRFRQHLQSANRRIKAVYFLDSGMASVVAVAGGDRQTEVAIIGHEGVTSLPVIFGADRSPCEVFIQVEGTGHCITAADLTDAMSKSASLVRTLLLFAHTFSVQAGYTALANARASLEERLARWLLMSQDRIEADELVLTHEFIALMLGVRRACVTIALQHFEAKGLITAMRGAVTIEDREGLVEAANGFYGTPEAEYERVFPATLSS